MSEPKTNGWTVDISRTKQEKGLLKAAFDAFQDAASLGGTYRRRRVEGELSCEEREYHKIVGDIESNEITIKQSITAIGHQLEMVTVQLDKAHSFLSPINKPQTTALHFNKMDELCKRPVTLKLEQFTADYQSFLRTATGAGAGTATAAGLWGAAQLLGHASTGTAMATLHGVAASSAGWAWFGGGSLATGGGGMALGHFVLPGIGTAVAVGVFAISSHLEANKKIEILGKVKAANETNLVVLRAIGDVRQRYAGAESKLEHEANVLTLAVQTAAGRLFRFGFLSRIWKRLRYFVRGYFYTSSEMEEVTRLERAVDGFMAAFQQNG